MAEQWSPFINFGWWPGDYTGGKCRDCGERMPFHGKRAYRCGPCAQTAWNAHQAIIDAPLICDMEHLTEL